MSKTGILIIEDHQLLREALELLISKEPDFEVVAEAGDGRQGLQLLSQRVPDIVILDVGLPEMNGIETCRQIKKLAPRTGILALSMHSSRRFVTEMLRAGASGYVLKSSGFRELIDALKTVVKGHRYLSPEIVDVVVDEALKGSSEEMMSPFSSLSSREAEIAQLLAEGKTAKEIGFSLRIAVRTVDAHKKSIFSKLGVSNIAELTRMAIQESIVDSHLQTF